MPPWQETHGAMLLQRIADAHQRRQRSSRQAVGFGRAFGSDA